MSGIYSSSQYKGTFFTASGDGRVVLSICLVPDQRLPHFAGVEVQLFTGYVPMIGDKFVLFHDYQDALSALQAAEQRNAELVATLAEARRAIGDHFAPDDCYATGPLTGNDYRDLVECPACSFIAMYESHLAAASPNDRKES